MPILNELKKRMVPEKTFKEKIRRISASKGIIGVKSKIETLDSIHEDFMGSSEQYNEDGNNSDVKRQAADMKNILGYLN